MTHKTLGRSLPMIVALVAAPVPASAVDQAPTSAQFIDMLGVNLHVNYTDGAYARIGNVVQAMRFLGITHARTALPSLRDGGFGVRGSAPLASYLYMAGAGIRFTFIAYPDIDRAVGTARSILAARPGSIAAIEGFNEINNFPVTYGGMKSDAAAILAQKALYAAVRADPAFRTIPVYDLTGAPPTTDISGRADLANGHPYTQNARQPGPSIARGYTIYGAKPGAIPMVVTEFGNFSLPADWPAGKPLWAGHTMLGVDERTQAKIILNGFAESARLGVRRSYVYELVDQKPDPTGRLTEMHYGLFHFDFSPKPSAAALHNLTTIISTEANYATHPSASPAILSLASAAPSIRSLTLRQPDASVVFLLWNEVPFWTWSQSASNPLTAPSIEVTFRLDRNPSSIRVYDPLNGPSPQSVQANGRTLRIAVPDHVIIVAASGS